METGICRLSPEFVIGITFGSTHFATLLLAKIRRKLKNVRSGGEGFFASRRVCECREASSDASEDKTREDATPYGPDGLVRVTRITKCRQKAVCQNIGNCPPPRG
jgi:hypothetical protein